VTAKVESQLTVLSYNIHKGRAYFSRKKSWHVLIDLLFTLKPDVVFLQEFFREPESEEALEAAADSLWPFYSYGKNAVQGKFDYGNAILSKNPILHSENLNITTNRLEPRGLLYATIEPKIFGRVHLACTHLNLTHSGRSRQLQSIHQFFEGRINPDDRLIFAGDFNDWSNRLQSQIVGQFNVQDALSAHLKYDAPTFPSFYPMWPLDKIYQRNFEVVESRCLENEKLKFQSDHLPIFTVLKI